MVSITGRNIGLSTTVLSVAYSGGSEGFKKRFHSLSGANCTIVSPGVAIQARFSQINSTE